MNTLRFLKHRSLLALSLVVLLAACGEDGSVDPGDSPAGFLVGDWIATSLVLTNQANPDESLDLVNEIGAEFTFDVQPSGRYLAILSGFGQSASESGRLRLSGDILTMNRELPTPETTVSVVTRDGTNVVLDGDSTFDFNQDGIVEDAVLHLVLAPR